MKNGENDVNLNRSDVAWQERYGAASFLLFLNLTTALYIECAARSRLLPVIRV